MKEPPEAWKVGVAMVVFEIAFVSVYLLAWENASEHTQVILNRISWSWMDSVGLCAAALGLYGYYRTMTAAKESKNDLAILKEFAEALRKSGFKGQTDITVTVKTHKKRRLKWPWIR